MDLAGGLISPVVSFGTLARGYVVLCREFTVLPTTKVVMLQNFNDLLTIRDFITFAFALSPKNKFGVCN